MHPTNMPLKATKIQTCCFDPSHQRLERDLISLCPRDVAMWFRAKRTECKLHQAILAKADKFRSLLDG